MVKRLAVVATAMALGLVGCGEPEPADEPAGTVDAPEETERAPSEEASQDHPDFVAVLRVNGTHREDGSLDLRSTTWQAMSPADASHPELTGDAVDGEGTATLTDADGQVLAEAPVQVRETIGHTTDGSFSESSVTATLLVEEGYGQADHLRLELDDGTSATLEGEDDVDLVLHEVPEPGPVDPDATVSWEASTGTVEGRWLSGSGEPVLTGRSGSEALGRLGLPPQGDWLVLVASEGLSVVIDVAGPYEPVEGEEQPAEWHVHVDGERIDEVGPVVIRSSETSWFSRVNVVLIPPGGADVPPDDIEATWISDVQGDLTDLNRDPGPSLRLNAQDLESGEHVWTLSLRADLGDGEVYTHEEQVRVEVL